MGSWRGGTDGWALTDAVVASLVLGAVIALALQALPMAGRAEARAIRWHQSLHALGGDLEARRAELPSPVTSPALTVETQVVGAERPVALCRRSGALHFADPVRRLTVSTMVVCPPEAP